MAQEPAAFEPAVFEAFYWGLISAISLNMGSVIGVTCLPGAKIRAVLMSFGGGALLFALSIELFASVLQKSEEKEDISLVLCMMASAIFGGCFFAALNHLLNIMGADVRKTSTTKSRFARLRSVLMRRLAVRLLKIPFFSVLDLDELKDLIQSAMYKERFDTGDIIMSDEAGDSDIFFILSGEVRIKILDKEENITPASPPSLKDTEKTEKSKRQTSPDPKSKEEERKERERASTFSEGDFLGHRGSASFPLGVMKSWSTRTDDRLVTPELTLHEWILGPNQIFGDMTVLAGTHSKIVAEAMAPTKVLVLPGREVARLVEINPAVRDHVSLRAVERLRHVAELQHLPETALASLSTNCSLVRYQPGDVVFRGSVDEATPILCLVLGSVEIGYQDSPKTRTWHAARLLCTEHLKTGVVGQRFSAKALEPTSVLVISRVDINNVIARGCEFDLENEEFEASGEDNVESIRLPGAILDDKPSVVVVAAGGGKNSTVVTDLENQNMQEGFSMKDIGSIASRGTPASIVKVKAWMTQSASKETPVTTIKALTKQDILTVPSPNKILPSPLKEQRDSGMGMRQVASCPSPRDARKDSKRSMGEAWSHLGWDEETVSDEQRHLRLSRLREPGLHTMGQVTDADLVEQEMAIKCSTRTPTKRGQAGMPSPCFFMGDMNSETGGGSGEVQMMRGLSGDLATEVEPIAAAGTVAVAQMGRQTSSMSAKSAASATMGDPADLESGNKKASSKLAPLEQIGRQPMNTAVKRAVMVWLGILIDAVPESLVIGILVNKSAASGENITQSAAAAALPFVMGVFLSNLPESMSSSGSMLANGMKVRTILLMWAMTTVLTAFGSAFGAVLFPPGDNNHTQDLVVVSVEGLAAGAMLTMIAQTMMPEAFEQGGEIVGLSCLVGFLSALSVKLIPLGGPAH